MKYNPEKHHRRSIRLKGYDYTRAGWYFITICVQNRECLLGAIRNGEMVLNDYGKIAAGEWVKTAEIRANITLDAHVVMPNHLHGIIVINPDGVGATGHVGAIGPVAPTTFPITPTSDSSPIPRLYPNSLGAIIGQYKSVVTKKIRKTGLPGFKWQRDYYEHIIRAETDLQRIREYIQTNPARWREDSLFAETPGRG